MTPMKLLPALLAVLLIAGCGGDNDSGSGGGGQELSLVTYSTPQEAYEELIPAFNKTPEGKGVSFKQSYGPSGDQARAVIGGLPADYVAFSLEPDMTKLVDESLVAEDWNSGPDKGMVSRSVVALVVRKGNPENIQDFDDLTKEGVEVVTPNVFTSGGAKWNTMAIYGSKTQTGASEEEAEQFLTDVYDNVSAQPESARDALSAFSGGEGDVLISYENEAITAQQKGEDVEYVIPPSTLLIENPAAPTVDAPEAAKAFVDYLRTPDAQTIFAEKGYRPIDDSARDKERFPDPSEKLFTIDDLGGWETVNTEFFDPEDSVLQRIQEDLGVSTSG